MLIKLFNNLLSWSDVICAYKSKEIRRGGHVVHKREQKCILHFYGEFKGKETNVKTWAYIEG
jgi:hypothetical protein